MSFPHAKIARAAALAAVIALSSAAHAETPVTAIPTVAPGAPFMIAAAGDIAGQGHAQRLTASLLLTLLARADLKAVLALGDTQYPAGSYRDYLSYYAPTWGVPAIKSITHPVPGNHEYDQGDSDADGYFDYFNGVGQAQGMAGDRNKGWYSFDIGDWHFIALNTSDGCHKVRCDPGSPMHTWLLRDLAATHSKCVLAYFHHPRFLRGDVHADERRVAPLWNALFDAHADVVLSGHEHNFQQLAPLDKNGATDNQHGIRSFVVGTGGANLYTDPGRAHRGAIEKIQLDAFGVLALQLKPTAYNWRFVTATRDGQGTVTATGEDGCR